MAGILHWGMGGWQGATIAAAALAWLAGIAVQLQQPALGSREGAVLLACGAGLLLPVLAWGLARPAWRRARAGLWLAAALALAGLAGAQTAWRAHARLADRLSAELEGVDLRVTGRVASMPQLAPDGVRFEFEVAFAQDATGAERRLPARLWLSWRRGWQEDTLLAGPPAALQAGQRWRLPLRLKQPHGVLNPHGFDAELWLFEQGIGAVGAVRASAPQDPQPLPPDGAWAPLLHLEAARQRWRDALLLTVPDSGPAGVLAALAVGDQAAIEGPLWEVFRQTGVAHLMSISGLHITLFAGLAGAAAGALWRRSTRLCLAWPAHRAGRWAGVALALGYALLAGWGVPAQRTVAMLALAAWLQEAGGRWPPLLVCLVAAAGVAAADPWALMQPGFWLSFGAVLVLMFSGLSVAPPPARPEAAPAAAAARRPPAQAASATPAAADGPAMSRLQRLVRPWGPWGAHLLRQAVRTQVVASLALAPLGMLLFHQVSLLGLLANLVAVPWVTLVVTPLALAGLLWPPLWLMAAAALAPLLALLQAGAEVAGGGWIAPAAPAWAWAAAMLGTLGLVCPGPWRWRLLGLPMLLPLLWPALPQPAPGRFELVAVDVGQGSAVLVRTRHHLLVHDAGPQFSRDSDAGRRVLLPLLWARGERRIDELQLSHQDLDHVGGAASLLAALPVLRWRSSLPPSHPLRAWPPPHTACSAGQHWDWDGVRFEVLHPPAGLAAPGERPNTRSCVLRVVGQDGRAALLTGDIEAAQESALVAGLGPGLAADILIVPHHGSLTSSTPALLAAVRPRVAVIQVGHRSRYGHPHPEVLARYAATGIPVVRTDVCGAWVWGEDGASCTREVHRRYWHWRPAGWLPVGGAVVARGP